MEAVSSCIQPKDSICAIDSGSRECLPVWINAGIDLCALIVNGFNGTADGDGVSIGACCLLEDNRAYGGDWCVGRTDRCFR